MSLLKRGKIYYAIIRVDGKQRWVSCGPDRREAKRMHDELVAKAWRGKFPQTNSVRFEEFAEQFKSDYVDVRLKQSTRREYKMYLKNYLVPYFGHKVVSKIATRDVQAFIASEVEGGQLKAKTIANHYKVLRRVLEVAVEWGVIETNPAARATPPRVPRTDIAFLHPQEVRALIEATDPEHRLLVATACLCGARKGELIGLLADAVSVEKRTITIKRSVYAGELQEPKTKRSVRVLPMPEALVPMYEARMAEIEHPLEYVFPAVGGGPMSNGTPNRILRRGLVAAGLKKQVTWHSLRHSFVAMAIEAKVPLKVISDLCGHGSILVSMDVYGHLLPGAEEAASRAISGLVFGTQDADSPQSVK